ncbi:MAG: hypothetical protein Q7R47_01610 [Candidatus Diapherotrites archaeon]|nr:hypothetical protein [Candidatus Diapherotrites archaeon]
MTKAVSILHYPRLDTVLMVEDAIKDADDYPTRTQLWRNLPKQVQYQTFTLILEYLEKSHKIIFTKDHKVMWVGSNPKLDEIIRKGKEL